MSKGRGFLIQIKFFHAILNGMTYGWDGRLTGLPAPYPGSNLFSLASGGAIYIRDPHQKIVDEQLNGGKLDTLTPEDWALIKPYLEENERLFGISPENHLLTVNGSRLESNQIYRKVRAVKSAILSGDEENPLPE